MFRFILLSFCLVLAGCNLLKPSKRVDPVEVVVSVEVDGKPYEIKRTIQCWINYGWDAANGNTASSMIDFTIFGEKIHDGQALVIDMPNLCSPNARTLKIRDLSTPRFYPKIYILDDYYRPQSIEIYNSEAAYEAETSRVKYNGFKSKFVPLQWFWPFQADWEDRFSKFLLKPSFSDKGDNHLHFQVLGYSKLNFSDETVHLIQKEFPEVIPKGIYRLEQKGNNQKQKHRPSDLRIKNIILQSTGCYGSSQYDCLLSYGQKKDGLWYIDTDQKGLRKGYLVKNPPDLDFTKEWSLPVVIEGQQQTVTNDPNYYNMWIDFDQQVFWEFVTTYRVTEK